MIHRADFDIAQRVFDRMPNVELIRLVEVRYDPSEMVYLFLWDKDGKIVDVPYGNDGQTFANCLALIQQTVFFKRVKTIDTHKGKHMIYQHTPKWNELLQSL